MNNKFGIYENSYRIIVESLKSFPEIRKAIIFGSRAMKNAKKGSDIDLAISGEEINEKIVNRLSMELNSNTPIPYYINIVHLEKITNKDLRDHIEKHGVLFYEPK